MPWTRTTGIASLTDVVRLPREPAAYSSGAPGLLPGVLKRSMTVILERSAPVNRKRATCERAAATPAGLAASSSATANTPTGLAPARALSIRAWTSAARDADTVNGRSTATVGAVVEVWEDNTGRGSPFERRAAGTVMAISMRASFGCAWLGRSETRMVVPVGNAPGGTITALPVPTAIRIVSFPPTVLDAVVGCWTVTRAEALTLGVETDAAEIVACPTETAVTTPAADTVATLGCVDDHVTAEFAPGSATTLACSVACCPTSIVAEGGDTVTDRTIGVGNVGPGVPVPTRLVPSPPPPQEPTIDPRIT